MNSGASTCRTECVYGMGCTNRIWFFPGVSPLMLDHSLSLCGSVLAKATLKMTEFRERINATQKEENRIS